MSTSTVSQYFPLQLQSERVSLQMHVNPPYLERNLSSLYVRGIFAVSDVAFIHTDRGIKPKSAAFFRACSTSDLIKGRGRGGLRPLENGVFLSSSEQIFRPASAACGSRQRFCARPEWGTGGNDPAPGKPREREREELHGLLEKTGRNREKECRNTQKEKEREHGELATPSCSCVVVPASTERCSKQPAPLPFSRPVPAGGHSRETPEEPAASRGQGRRAQGGCRRGAGGPGGPGGRDPRGTPLRDGVLRFSGSGGGRRERRGEAKRAAGVLPAPAVPSVLSPAPRRPPRTDRSPPPPPYAARGFPPFGGDCQSAAKASPPGGRHREEASSLPAPPPPRLRSSSRRPRTAGPFAPVAESCAPPASQTSLLDCSSLTAQELLQFRSLPPNRFARIGSSRCARLRFPAPARGGGGPRRQVPRREAGGRGPGEHLAPSQFSYGEILRQCLLR